MPSKRTGSGNSGQSDYPQSSRRSAGGGEGVRPWSVPSKSTVSGNSDQCVHIGTRAASWTVPCGAVPDGSSWGCSPTDIECSDGALTMLTRCHEFVDTTVAETRGDDVLDLRATRGSRGPVQSHSLLGMETPSGAILSSDYTGTVHLVPVTPPRVSVRPSKHVCEHI